MPVLIAAPAHADDQSAAPRAAVAEVAEFEFTDYSRDKFVIRLTDPAKIAHARRVLRGEETDKPTRSSWCAGAPGRFRRL
ncbi:hypothetical protein AB0M48_05605 [Lentzea sp. NPDC051208]|uniref:BP74-related protein n=1 Tax=Lentzea sp. NPDC051208 TaxID=3154642 RepID=UPI00344A62BD